MVPIQRDQDHNFHPTVLPSGQVLYQRWDYTGISHIYLRQLMTMNPDGRQQRAVYGSNSWFPNSLFLARALPDADNRLLCILSGYHGAHRMGQLVVVDPSVGWQEESGIVQRISGRGSPVTPKVRDALVNNDWPKFLHPFPLSDKYFLVSACDTRNSTWKIYLADVFDNLVAVHESPGYALLEPTPLVQQPMPPVIPDQVDLSAKDATVFVNDVYAGPGLAGVPRGTTASVSPGPTARSEPLRLEGWPQSAKQASAAQLALGETHRELKLADGVVLKLVHIPAGRFVMGDVDGEADEYPQRIVDIQEAFWMGTCEVTNAQFRCFDPSHDSGYYVKRRDRADGKGLSLNNDLQPVVRVSWQRATEFCEWLSQQTGTRITLPTEEQWEYACRAGGSTPLSYGSTDDDFAAWGNMADRRFSTGLMNARGAFMPEGGVTQATGGVPHLLLEGAKLADTRFDDGFRVTAEVGSFQANTWGLHDMHGNAAEWTLGEHAVSGEKYIRGGSFFDRPARCRSSFRLRYPSWQRVFNVGFRIVCEEASVGSGPIGIMTQPTER